MARSSTPTRRSWSAPPRNSRRTVIRFSVSVPVLSVQITVAAPSVSTDGRWRTSAWRAAMRWAAIASDSVTVWLNPTLGGVGDPTGGLSVSGVDLVWNTLMFSDYDGNSAAWDEMRWGTDFNSVTTVPEPASALLGSLGVLALLRRRRA